MMVSDIEKILGVPVGYKEVIPGTVPVEGTEFIYFFDNGCGSAFDQFDALTMYVDPPCAQSGGITTRSCSITLPDGSVFHAMGYHGDLAGWKQDIEAGAAGLNIPLARIEAGKFIVSDGRVFDLYECIPRFAWKDYSSNPK